MTDGSVRQSPPVFHLTSPGDWQAGLRDGVFAPESLRREGFIHLSFAEQIPATAARHFDGVAPLWAMEIDPTGIDDLRVEDLYGHGAFPHAYGPIPESAVIGVRVLRTEPKDRHASE